VYETTRGKLEREGSLETLKATMGVIGMLNHLAANDPSVYGLAVLLQFVQGLRHKGELRSQDARNAARKMAKNKHVSASVKTRIDACVDMEGRP
jgi:hypothetical protein